MAVMTQRARRRPVLFREEQTLLAPRPRWKQALKSVALPLILGRATAVYIGSENRRWLQRFGFPEERLFPAPLTASMPNASSEPGPRFRFEALRERFGIDGDDRSS